MAEALQNNVGAYLGITPSTTTIPTTAQIEYWLKEGSIEVMERAPLKVLQEKFVVASLNLTAGSGDLPADFLRMVYYVDATPSVLKVVSPEYRQYVQSGVNSYLPNSAAEAVISIENAKIRSSYTGGSTTGVITYVKRPADSADVPTELHDLVILYAVAQAKKEAQEVDEFGFMIQEFYQRLKDMES